MREMKRTTLFLILGIALLSLGTVIKRKNAVQQTQTDPVDYEQKRQETMEGKKGPPVPAIDLYPRERFLEQEPVEASKEAPVPPTESEGRLWVEEEKQEENQEEQPQEQWNWEDLKEQPEVDDMGDNH